MIWAVVALVVLFAASSSSSSSAAVPDVQRESGEVLATAVRRSAHADAIGTFDPHAPATAPVSQSVNVPQEWEIAPGTFINDQSLIYTKGPATSTRRGRGAF